MSLHFIKNLFIKSFGSSFLKNMLCTKLKTISVFCFKHRFKDRNNKIKARIVVFLHNSTLKKIKFSFPNSNFDYIFFIFWKLTILVDVFIDQLNISNMTVVIKIIKVNDNNHKKSWITSILIIISSPNSQCKE